MEKTWKPTTAGILSIIAGSMGIGFGAFITLLGGIMGLISGIAATIGNPALVGILGGLAGIIGMMGGALIGLGVVAVVGGIFALKRKCWGMALAGTICAIPCSGTLGILSVIFISIAKREFCRP